MIRCLISCRRNLFIVMLFLLAVSTFYSKAQGLCLGWLLEHERLRETYSHVIVCSVEPPEWYKNFQFFIKMLRIEFRKKLFIFTICNILRTMEKIWMYCFKWAFEQFALSDMEPFLFERMSSLIIEDKLVTLRLELTICPTITKEFESESKTVCNENKLFIENSELQYGLAYFPVSNMADEVVCELRDFGSQFIEEIKESCYDESIEDEMRKFYNTLSEKDKRRYAGIEAMKRSHGGIIYISEILGCSRKTVAKGMKELRDLPSNSGYEKRIRKSGAGRKCYDQTHQGIDEKFFDVLKNNIAGDPMQEEAVWTNLSYNAIVQKLAEKHGIYVSTKVIRQLLKNHRYGRRKAQKKMTMKEVANRDEQFENIARLRIEYEGSKYNPIISIDTKKKENLGNFYRDGHLYTRAEIETYDHDFKTFAEGVVIPHGIFDIKQNKGFINIGISKETGEFACDSLGNWWYQEGQYEYPNAFSILILCDGGGSNSSRHYLFKEDISKLSDEIGIEIRIAHYPPYTSKYNPIEHRLFPHVTRACQGVIFKNVETVKELIEKAKTTKGLKVTVQIIDKLYETGRKVTENFKENMKIHFDDYLPQWNYRVIPNGKVI